MIERAERWARGLASLALLAGLVVGVPAALVALGGDPLPRTVTPGGLWQALLRPDDGTVLARLLALVGWAAWAVFTLSLVVELVNLLRHHRAALVLPGLGGVQQWAAGLMLSVVAIGAASQVVAGPTAPSTVAVPAAPEPVAAPSAAPEPIGGSVDDVSHASPVVGAAEQVAPEDLRAVTPAPAPHGQRERVHVVELGDDLWSLAERYYGRGQEWRRIAAANPERLTGGPDRLRVGWRLVVPGADVDADEEAGRTVRVRRGDTLTTIAERRLGGADRWRDLYRANRDQLSDPDELPVGLVLRLPAPSAGTAGDDGSVDQGRVPADGGTATPTPTSSDDDADPAPAQSRPVPAPPSTSVPAPPGSAAASTGPDGGEPAGGTSEEADEPPATEEAAEGEGLLVPGLVVGGLLAAALTGGLEARRRWQLQHRPVGRRIAHPAPATRPIEVALARRVRPIGLRTLDCASRAVAAAAVGAGVPVPGLRSASLSAEGLVLELSGATPPAPRCFVDAGGSWRLPADAVDGLRDVEGIGRALRPWPLLVGVGTDADGAERVLDLESVGLLAVTGQPALVGATMAAIALELLCSPWTEELRLTLVGGEALAPALGQHNVETARELGEVLDRLERTSAARTAHADGVAARDLRVDPDRAEAWAAEVVVVDGPLSDDDADRLRRLVGQPGAAITAVVRGPVAGAVQSLRIDSSERATLEPQGLRLVPQALADSALDAVVELLRGTGSEETSPAPWWSPSEEDPPDAPPDNVTYLGARRRADDRDEQGKRAAVQARMTEVAGGTVRHPLLQLLGPVELLGAAGTAPTRAARQCLEYCAWLLEHPGSTAQEMAAGLLVAEGTRRSNMSRLRTWLGSSADGEPYLPDAYSGRIWLDTVVSSDWHQLRLLIGDGVDRAPTSVLELGLRLVRGAPLADAAPVQWHWAEQLRTDMVSCVRDIGVELARRALEDGDLDLARWAAARALSAAPGDELLMRARLRTEHLAGNAAETERLSLQIAQQARLLGADLAPATVDLIQEVMEGRVRARLA